MKSYDVWIRISMLLTVLPRGIKGFVTTGALDNDIVYKNKCQKDSGYSK